MYKITQKITQEVDKLPENFTGIVERADGSKYWLLNGKYHREDGPAIEWATGVKHWYLNGKFFSYQEEWQKELDKFKPTCDGKTVEIDGKKYKLVLTEG